MLSDMVFDFMFHLHDHHDNERTNCGVQKVEMVPAELIALQRQRQRHNHLSYHLFALLLLYVTYQ